VIVSNLLSSSTRTSDRALTSTPNLLSSAGVRIAIRRAGPKTSHACFSLVAPE
jgi:hypothetical protein